MVIKLHFFILMLLNILLFPVASLAGDYRHFIWSMSNPVKINDVNIEYDDQKHSATSEVTGGLNGYYYGNPLYRNCKGSVDSLKAINEKTAWIIMQNKIYLNNVPISINIDAYNKWTNPSQQEIAGYSYRINQTTEFTTLEQCWDLNNRVKVNYHWKSARVTITLEEGNLAPGIYRVPIAYYYAFEENKFQSHDQKAPHANVPNIILSNGMRNTFNLIINVKSKCDFNSNPLQLTHDVTLGDDSSYKSNLTSYSISCGFSTPVKMELIGTNKPTGKGINFTRCGEGDCELQFSDGKAFIEEKITGKKDFFINSIFHPHDITKTGTFQGSGVLRVTIQ